eukprot:Gregarina_sp_Poly_1__3475@NODE_2009_length_2869_cov_20_312634_g1298_i0_p1_GENE_NODE_2009_length_2869_cov_20_312634_g1298_i0NODE_2009_length_2869_cov_20_312634_g1298_i0_p1_ORF_typecomplete_len296_score41_59LsmAD/PF06741_13/7_2LsmAD/PF06741_13/23DUF3619/PF12279_8/0_037Glypican/PF01153_19/0_11Glypican/PF01153_19/5_5e03BBIP10/PF14777_6/0_29BBIP10/PF14777_6/2_8e03_NODE_2009_length_2869_cov_20_312634_g1298_i075962
MSCVYVKLLIIIEGKLSDKKLPEPLPMTIEAPNCAVEEILEPLKSQVKKRVEQMRRQAMQHRRTVDMGTETASQSSGDSTDSRLYREWWKRNDSEQEELRQHAAEIMQESKTLKKSVLESRGALGFMLPGMNDTRERVPVSQTEPEYRGPIDYEPYRLQENLFGTLPGEIKDIMPHAQNMAREIQKNAAGLRPLRHLGDSRKDFFVRDDDMKTNYLKKQLLRDYTEQDLLRTLPAVPSWSVGQLLRQMTLNQPGILFTADSIRTGLGRSSQEEARPEPAPEMELTDSSGTSFGLG